LLAVVWWLITDRIRPGLSSSIISRLLAETNKLASTATGNLGRTDKPYWLIIQENKEILQWTFWIKSLET